MSPHDRHAHRYRCPHPTFLLPVVTLLSIKNRAGHILVYTLSACLHSTPQLCTLVQHPLNLTQVAQRRAMDFTLYAISMYRIIPSLCIRTLGRWNLALVGRHNSLLQRSCWNGGKIALETVYCICEIIRLP